MCEIFVWKIWKILLGSSHPPFIYLCCVRFFACDSNLEFFTIILHVGTKCVEQNVSRGNYISPRMCLTTYLQSACTLRSSDLISCFEVERCLQGAVRCRPALLVDSVMAVVKGVEHISTIVLVNI